MRTLDKVITLFNASLSLVFSPSGLATRLAMIAGLVWLAGNSPATIARAQAAGTTIIVNSASDGFVLIDPWHPQPAPVCTLRDAITAANTNLPVAGCAAGRPSPAVDTILFNIGIGTPVINVRTQLPPITEPVSINGGSFGATRVELEGSRASFSAAVTGHKAHGLF